MGYLHHKRKAINYLSSHPEFNATIHAVGGFAVGMLVMYSFSIKNPLTWVIVLGVASILGHLYAASKGKK